MENFGVFTIDKTHLYSEQLPYVVIKTNSGVPITEEQWQRYEESFKALYAESIAVNHRFSIIFKVTLSEIPTGYIKKKGKLMISLKPQTKECLVSTAIIIENTLLRNTIRALFGVVYEVIRPQEFCAGMESALMFIQEHNSRDWSDQLAQSFLKRKNRQ